MRRSATISKSKPGKQSSRPPKKQPSKPTAASRPPTRPPFTRASVTRPPRHPPSARLSNPWVTTPLPLKHLPPPLLAGAKTTTSPNVGLRHLPLLLKATTSTHHNSAYVDNTPTKKKVGSSTPPASAIIIAC